MQILLSKQAEKRIRKLDKKIILKIKDRLNLYFTDPKNRQLNLHDLSGQFEGLKSINLSGDYRLLFNQLDRNTIKIQDIGTHSQLYG